MQEITLKISGMTCRHCVMHVTNALKGLDGVLEATVSLEDKSAVVAYDETRVDRDAMVDAVKEAGYQAN